MSNQLTKADVARKKQKNPDSLLSALQNGGPVVWLSCLIMGLGNIAAGQIVKGIIFLAIEIVFFAFMFMQGGGISNLSMLPSLGDRPMQEVWNDEEGIYEYVMGDQSLLILLFGVATVFAIGLFIVLWRASVRSGYKALCIKKAGKKPWSFIKDIKELFDSNIHKFLMLVPFGGILVFTIVPLVYMICMAFTDYSTINDKLILFDWVGLDNFKQLFQSGGAIAGQFWDVLGWTLVWAFFATFLNFFLGTFVALIINRPTTHFKGLWRTIFSLTIAIPQFVSLLLINSMFRENGIVNSLFQQWGWIDTALPFLTKTNWARTFVIVVNLWVGIPYTIMQVTGILQNIPSDLYEAARIDGANAVQQFMNITLPYMIFVLTPYIISSFTGNINNFNVIYLLTGGGPNPELQSAGKTDLLVTWLFKLTMNEQKYNLGAVIGILTFVILAVVSLVTYRSSGSYKDEEGFK